MLTGETILITFFLFIAQSTFFADSAFSESEKLEPNEAGRIMVLMYHGVGPKERVWVRSTANFKSDLETLYEKGYRPVSLRNFVNNQIDIEAGLTPVVLTFDDGRIDNFRVVEKEGKPKVSPDCAVGILQQFQKDHPDFKATATFFLNGPVPFGQPEWVDFKLNYLVANGMDIGNHTAAHDNFRLKKYSKRGQIERAIGKQSQFLTRTISATHNYRVDTLALCHGARPQNKKLYKHLVTGQYKGVEYKNIAILNVGSGPAHSPVTTKFKPFSIPRIRAGEIATEGLGISDWIKHFDRHPDRRYVSDGSTETVTVPKRLSDLVDHDNLGEARLVLTD